MRAVRAFGVAAVAMFAARCITIEDATLGDSCEDTEDCDNPRFVCALLDEAQPGGTRVCVPMRPVDEPVACEADTECMTKGYPVDATCVDGACACAGDRFALVCDVTEEIMDPLTCLCVTAPDDAE